MKKINITEKEVKTQTDAIMWHLKNYGNITSWEAIQKYGVTRLASKIYNMRKNGYEIESVILHTTNRFNRNIQIAKYIYNEPKTIVDKIKNYILWA
tara:strand:+ start:1186 stop:1473 length:288 start_codon:yes stop_codon:yes gene_type:complete